MTSAERFNSVLNHKKPDRMPFYVPTVACSVASKILGHEAHTGGDSLHFDEECSWLEGENAHLEFVHRYREDTVALARALGVDVVREGWRSKRRPAKKLDDHTLLFGDEDGRYTVKRYFSETQSYGVVKSTEGYRSVDELLVDMKKSLNEEHAHADEDMTGLYHDHLEMKILAGADFATIAGALAIGFDMYDTVWLEATALHAELLRDYYLHTAMGMAKQVKWFKEHGFRFLNAGSDIAAQYGPVISPRAFGIMLEPALKLMAEECARQGIVYCYKSDGNMWSLCDCLFGSAGLQAYGEADRLASMTVGELRKRYPGLIILGNVSSVTLCNGSEQQVREETRATLMESGGFDYIAGPSNAIVHGTPVRNVFAMAEEIKNFRP